jgi:uncharacterized protein with PIN domain
MVVDTSALVAIFLGEPEADLFDAAIAQKKCAFCPRPACLRQEWCLPHVATSIR